MEAKDTRLYKAVPSLLIPALGMVCFRLSAWTSSIGGSMTGAVDTLFISRVIQCITLILLLILDRKITYHRIGLVRIMMAFCLVKMAASFFFIGVNEDIFWYIGSGIYGVCSAVMMLCWGYYFCSISPWKSTYGLVMAFAIYAIATWLFSFLSLEAIYVLMVLAPLLSFLCFKHTLTDEISHTGAEFLLQRRHRDSIPWDISLILIICTVISILAKVIVPVGVTFSDAYPTIRLFVLLFIFLFYTIWMLVSKRQDFDLLWPIFVLIIFSGLLFYSSLAGTQPGFATSFFRATQECFMLFCWIVTASAAYRLKLPRVFSFGLVMVVILSPPVLVSEGINLIFGVHGGEGFEIASVIIAAIIALVLIAVSVVLIMVNSTQRTKRSVKEVYEGQAASYILKAANTLIEEFGLTKREGEVLHLLIRGQSFSQIADTLVLSINTVRTHIKNIYRKMDINGKPQLIAMVEERIQPLLLISQENSEPGEE